MTGPSDHRSAWCLCFCCNWKEGPQTCACSAPATICSGHGAFWKNLYICLHGMSKHFNVFLEHPPPPTPSVTAGPGTDIHGTDRNQSQAKMLLVNNFRDLRLPPFGSCVSNRTPEPHYPTTPYRTYSDFFSILLATRHLRSLPSPLLVLSPQSLAQMSPPRGPLLSTELSHSTVHHLIIFPLVSIGESKLGHARQVFHR